MRQVGDRLIPVGVTSGRVHTLPTTEGADGLDTESGTPGSATSGRRRRGQRANGQTDLSQLLGQMGLGGQDLEEVDSHLFFFLYRCSPYTSSWSWKPCVCPFLSTKRSKEGNKRGSVVRVSLIKSLPGHHPRHPVLTSLLRQGPNPVLRHPWWRKVCELMIPPLVLQLVVAHRRQYQVKQPLHLHVGLPLTT